MVLRLLLAALVLANLVYFLWSMSVDRDAGEREPQRLTQQVRPELLDIRKPPPDAPGSSNPARPADR